MDGYICKVYESINSFCVKFEEFYHIPQTLTEGKIVRMKNS